MGRHRTYITKIVERKSTQLKTADNPYPTISEAAQGKSFQLTSSKCGKTLHFLVPGIRLKPYYSFIIISIIILYYYYYYKEPTLLVFKILLIFTRFRRERLMIQHHSEHTELTVTTDITSARGSKWTRWRPHKPTTALVSISSIISRGKTLDWNTIMMQHVYVNQAKTKSYRYRQTFHIKYFPPNSPQLVILYHSCQDGWHRYQRVALHKHELFVAGAILSRKQWHTRSLSKQSDNAITARWISN